MCGILGEFGKVISSKNQFSDLMKLSVKRGSDMIGYYNNISQESSQKPLAQFGFNRLAIMDLRDIANQPMISKSKRYVVMCNGEIVNHLNLKEKIGITNNDLRTTSDTEIVCHALDTFGFHRTINLLNGMYAMSVYDLQNNVLHLVRDPAGIKPLYYAQTDFGWIFASQYDQIFKHPWFFPKLKINPEALTDYLRLGYVPAPAALFEKSWLLEPGSYLTIQSDFNAYSGQYYVLDSIEKFKETNEETVAELTNILQNTFSDYIHSDVPLGSFLSGGVDSPIVNAILSKSLPDLKAFTISNSDFDFDESSQAKMISSHLGIEHHVEHLSELKVANIIDKQFLAFSEPFADYSSIPTYILCSEASKYYKVLLSGDGGDELFWGYPRFLSTIDYQKWFNYPKSIRLLWAGILRRFGMRISSGIELDNIGEWVFERQSPNWHSDVARMVPNLNHSFSTKALYSSPNPDCSSVDLLMWLRKNEFYGHMQRVLLKVDRASMAHNLEVRVPFLDKRIINFSSYIKPELGIKHRQTKYLLKQVLNKYVPQNYYLNEKRGFSFNLSKLLDTELKENIQDTLMSNNLFGSELIEKNIIHKTVNKFYGQNEIRNEWGLWVLFSLQKWANLFYNK